MEAYKNLLCISKMNLLNIFTIWQLKWLNRKLLGFVNNQLIKEISSNSCADSFLKCVVIFLLTKSTRTFDTMVGISISKKHYGDVLVLGRTVLENSVILNRIKERDCENRARLFWEDGLLRLNRDKDFIEEIKSKKGSDDQIDSILSTYRKHLEIHKEDLRNAKNNRELEFSKVAKINKNGRLNNKSWCCLSLKDMILDTKVDKYHDLVYILASGYVHPNIWLTDQEYLDISGEMNILEPGTGLKKIISEREMIFPWHLSTVVYLNILFGVVDVFASDLKGKSKVFKKKLDMFSEKLRKIIEKK